MSDKLPDYTMDEDDFERTLEELDITDEQLIEAMVWSGWTKGKEIDIHAKHYPDGNLYYPPEAEKGEMDDEWDANNLIAELNDVESCIDVLKQRLIDDLTDGVSRDALIEEQFKLRDLQSECIRLGYGERDTDGNFRPKEME